MENNYINLMDYLKKLLSNKSFIFKFCIVGGIIGLVVAFSIPKMYVASVSFAPETQQKFGAGMSSIASMVGANFDNSIDAISEDLYPEVVKSVPFIFPLLDVQIETRDSLSTDFLDYIVNYQKKPWWNYVFEAPFKLLELIKGKPQPTPDSLFVTNAPPREARIVISYLHHNLNLRQNPKNGMFVMTLSMQDPKVASTILNQVVENLKNYMTDYRTQKERQDVENLLKIYNDRKVEYYAAQKAYAEYEDSHKNLTLMSAQSERQRLLHEMNLSYQVYSQVATQLEASRIKVQKSKPVFAVIEPVVVPHKASSPSKSKIFIAFLFLSICFSSFWVLFGREMWNSFRNDI